MRGEEPSQSSSGIQPGKVDLLGLPIDQEGLQLPSDLDAAQERQQPFLATFVNPHAYHIAQCNPDFIDLLSQFDHVSCDGIGLVLAARLHLKTRIPRQAFDTTSIALPVLEWARANGRVVFLVGGKSGIASKAAEILSARVSGLAIAGVFSGFEDGPILARNRILESSDTLVICGMGAPLQERFLLSLVSVGWRGIGFTCGGFFDQLCEREDYYPAWIDRMNLRFLYRLFKEPSRLWKRYLLEYQVFLGRSARALLKR